MRRYQILKRVYSYCPVVAGESDFFPFGINFTAKVLLSVVCSECSTDVGDFGGFCFVAFFFFHFFPSAQYQVLKQENNDMVYRIHLS